MRYLLYLPGIILMLLPMLSARSAAIKAERARRQQEAERAAAAEQRRIQAERKRVIQAAKAAERERAKAAREAEQQRKQAARLEAARLRAEYAERELAARREAKALERGEIVPATQEQPAEPALNAKASAEQTEPASAAQQDAGEIGACRMAVAPGVKGNNAFAGQMVAFTGRLPGMTRREAIQAVRDNGGRAYEKMPAGTTLLVVGDKPGMCKMDKADEWIGQVRKITAAQFFAMLAA